MTRYVVNNREVAHLWAHQAQGSAENGSGSVSFNGNTINSYNTPIGKIVTNSRGQRAYLLNSNNYSVTTSKHQSAMWKAIPPFAIVFSHSELPCRQEEYSRVLRQMIEELPDMEAKASRARSSKARRLRELECHIALINEFADFFDLEHTPVSREGTAEAIEEAVRNRKAEQYRREESRRKEQEARQEKAQEALAEWINGKDVRVDLSVLPCAALRLRPYHVGVVETTLGATVPTYHVRRVIHSVLGAMKRCRDNGVEWVPENPIRLGHYGISYVDTEGTLSVGCHKFTIEEVERFAGVLDKHFGDVPAGGEEK